MNFFFLYSFLLYLEFFVIVVGVVCVCELVLSNGLNFILFKFDLLLSIFLLLKICFV